jgi:hypothetical protein
MLIRTIPKTKNSIMKRCLSLFITRAKKLIERDGAIRGLSFAIGRSDEDRDRLIRHRPQIIVIKILQISDHAGYTKSLVGFLGQFQGQSLGSACLTTIEDDAIPLSLTQSLADAPSDGYLWRPMGFCRSGALGNQWLDRFSRLLRQGNCM